MRTAEHGGRPPSGGPRFRERVPVPAVPSPSVNKIEHRDGYPFAPTPPVSTHHFPCDVVLDRVSLPLPSKDRSIRLNVHRNGVPVHAPLRRQCFQNQQVESFLQNLILRFGHFPTPR